MCGRSVEYAWKDRCGGCEFGLELVGAGERSRCIGEGFRRERVGSRTCKQ